MRYRDVPDSLPLEGIHVACICGDDGHGKSALLGGITWALWGKARGRSADDLIHFGESDMEVELEFSNGEDVYRVVRKRKRATHRVSGASVPELQVSGKGLEGIFRPITGNTIAETQAQVSRLVRLEYETFVNSAFLRQGRADEFTLRTPGGRKEVLADILDLSLYDEHGARSYEMLSGGEAFRVNCALRVAISWLLTRRAWAPLRMLFIDEGFGIQD